MKSSQRFLDNGADCVFEWETLKLYSTDTPAVHLLIPQVRNRSWFTGFCCPGMHKTYSLSPFWYEAAFVLASWAWFYAASLHRTPATPLGCCNSTAHHSILPAKILSSGAAASISSSSLQIVILVTFFWMSEGPTGKYINETINLLFHVSLCLNILLPSCSLKVTVFCP